MSLERKSPDQLVAAAGANDYGLLASSYEALANFFSAGQIRAVKKAQLADIRPNDRVLYAGAGGGEDAAMAARVGARVTVLDLSPKMLAQAERRFRREGVHGGIERIVGNVLLHRPASPYDVVCSNFFLDVFSRSVAREVLAHLCALVRPDGKLLIADFTPAEGSVLLRFARQAYVRASSLSCCLLAKNAFHGAYDYRDDLAAAGFRAERTTPCGLFFSTITARAPARPHDFEPGCESALT